jgi:formiminoglutamate deiminase
MLPVFYAHANFGGKPFVSGQRRFISDVGSFAKMVEACGRMVRQLPDANVGVAPHSLRAVTPEELRDLVAIAGDRPIHIHVAEQTREVDDCVAWSGKRPVQWLMENAPVDQRWCLIHATHVTPEETRAMAQSGAVVGLCPITEANLGDGVFPAVEYFEAGGAFGIGTDSNVLIDAGEELRTMEYAQRLTRRKRSVLAQAEGSTGGELFRRALAGGQRATQSQGGLKIGAPADIVSLDGASSLLAHRSGDAHLDSWVFAGGKRLVKDVWRRGRKIVQDGRHLARDAIQQRYTQALGRILA